MEPGDKWMLMTIQLSAASNPWVASPDKCYPGKYHPDKWQPHIFPTQTNVYLDQYTQTCVHPDKRHPDMFQLTVHHIFFLCTASFFLGPAREKFFATKDKKRKLTKCTTGAQGCFHWKNGRAVAVVRASPKLTEYNEKII